MNLKPSISVVVVVKNEADKIETCLDHLKWVDETIIIDNGSTDDTVRLCKKYTNRIYYHNKPELIPFLQNLGIQKATKDWIIIIDADVIVPTEAKLEILEKIKSEEYDGFYLHHVLYFLGRPLSSKHFGEHPILKLFRNGKGYFKGEYPHESLTFSGKRTRHIISRLPHYAHPTIADFIIKMNKYTSEDALKKSVTRRHSFLYTFITPFISIFYYFLIRQGIKDGIRGLIYCSLLGVYMFTERIKIWEQQYKKRYK